jgi:hypothetical protein
VPAASVTARSALSSIGATSMSSSRWNTRDTSKRVPPSAKNARTACHRWFGASGASLKSSATPGSNGSCRRSKSCRLVRISGARVTGPKRVAPMKPAVVVDTPSMLRAPNDVSSM